MPRRILISGAASGLGFQFLRSYSEDPSNHIIAIDKQPLPPAASRRGNIEYLETDITSDFAIRRLRSHLGETSLDLVIHSAGVRGLVPRVEDENPDDVAACETLQVMNADTLTRTFETNAVGTFSLVRCLLPNLKLSSDAKVIIMSSRMGSISQNTTGSAYAYRASKAALNAIIKSFSIDEPDIVFILCHPGRVETNLVKCKEEGAMSVNQSVSGMIPWIERWNKSDSGKFFDRSGESIKW
ncbi:NAD(P)-binding protein [Myriangium duriaei CBS 260.36]|uniref:NAD(P)-binding protein n=1 Tax=Myriangium duriaei CBS 260.36 TaxID=1168546 RepID=A0A9P4IXZ1_9PEZI|nr:NAD(P)-binding protein [Myriangium duriaei CBS 260.36]